MRRQGNYIILINIKKARTGGLAQVVECLLCKCAEFKPCPPLSPHKNRPDCNLTLQRQRQQDLKWWRPTWATQQVQGQPQLHSRTLCQKNELGIVAQW
jgi:hypothetical protein